jgi:hypothetical protein
MTITNVSRALNWLQGFAGDQLLLSKFVAIRQAESPSWFLRPDA